MRYVLGIALIIAVVVPAMIITAAQNQPLKFDVVSIKPDVAPGNQRQFFACRGTDGFD